MIISLIAAQAENRVIGYKGKTPWHLPDDLRHFLKLTRHHHLIMGKNTYISLGRPLPKRVNIVLTRSPSTPIDGCVTTNSFDQAIAIALLAGDPEVFIIGGEQVYRLALPYASRIYLTQLHAARPQGDTYFPHLDPQIWIETSRIFHPADNDHRYSFSFLTLEHPPTNP